ncbi:Uncharacterized protein HZ326_22738 [Fusarium oxysporum f. sp. albedinis]|nr:Uncharacterized protein HZ326_22738 [Fusarium oxysporum f. sp. albedinis]
MIEGISENIGFVNELQSIVDIIDTAPLQLYASAIALALKQSIVRQTFEHYLPGWISPPLNVYYDRNAILQTLEGHMGLVNSVVFSNDRPIAHQRRPRSLHRPQHSLPVH